MINKNRIRIHLMDAVYYFASNPSNLEVYIQERLIEENPSFEIKRLIEENPSFEIKPSILKKPVNVIR